MKPEQIKAERERFETVLRDMESMSRDKGISDERAAGYYDAAKLVQEALDASPEPARAEPVALTTDDDVEALARQCGWDNRRYMKPAHYAEWCERMREFAALARPPCPAVTLPEGWPWDAGTRNHLQSFLWHGYEHVLAEPDCEESVTQLARWLDQSPEQGGQG